MFCELSKRDAVHNPLSWVATTTILKDKWVHDISPGLTQTSNIKFNWDNISLTGAKRQQTARQTL